MDKPYLDLLLAHMQTYDSYHSQKENMTWLAATLYLAGAVGLVIMDDPPWRNWCCAAFAGFLLLLFGTAVMGVRFVCWQFANRKFAADLFRACANVAARWTEKRPDDEALKPVNLDQTVKAPLLVPAELATEYKEVSEMKITPWAKYLTLGTMLLWSIAAVVRVLQTAPH